MAEQLPFIIEPTDLVKHLDEDNLLIVDLSSPQHYQQGHLPGAVHVLPQELVAGTPPAPGKLPANEQLQQLFSRLGLSETSRVVAYDDEGGGWAGRFIWTLDIIGHQFSSYLNGGLWAWQGAGLPLSTEIPTPTPSSVSITIDSTFMADKNALLQNLGRDNYVVWDARSKDEYLGKRQTAQKNGHIPGAIHCEWTELMDHDKALRIRDDARTYLESKGIHTGQEIVTHCQTHHRSGFTYLVGKALGLNIKAYPGSWSEWGNSPDTPVE